MEQILATLQAWGLAPASLALAVLVFVGVAILALRKPDPSRLEDRVRGIGRNGPRDGSGAGSPLVSLRMLPGRQPLDRFRQKAVDWFADHVIVGEQKRLTLLQAGFRQPKTYLYFELARATFGIVFGAVAVLAIERFGLFDRYFLLAMAASFFALMLGLYLPGIYLRQRIAARRRAFVKYWDDALGLLVICLDAGLSIEIAMRRIARELAATAPVLAEELIITVTDLSLLKERKLAYQGLATRMELTSVKSVTIALVQAEKQGASIANSLRIIAQTNREARVTAAEEKAAALGPKMTVPMIVFFLPVVFIIIMAPMVMKAMQ